MLRGLFATVMCRMPEVRLARGISVLGHRGFRRCAVVGLALLAAGASSAEVAGGASGGAAVGGTSKPAQPSSARHGSAVLRARANPFGGRAMWIWVLSRSSGGNVGSLIARAHRYGISTLMIKSGDGASAWSQFSRQLVSSLHAGGLRVCAWQYVYGVHPVGEARVGAAAVANGADCLLIDAESQYEGKYISAQTYTRMLRQRIGGSFPVALAGFPYVDYHPAF